MVPNKLMQPSRRYILIALFFVIALYVLIPQLGQFKSSWQVLRHLEIEWLITALLLTAATYCLAAATYYLLATKPLKYGRTVVIQLTAMFVNRLLPAGIGALGANYVYLRRNKHTNTQAVTIVAVNNLLGLVGHTILTVVCIGLLSSHVSLTGKYHYSTSTMLTAVVIIVIGAAVTAIFARQKAKRVLAGVGQQLLSYKTRKLHLGLALLSSMGLTLANILALYCCTQALGVSLGLVAILIVFSLGVGVGTAVPTPGGLGGFEAGLVAGFVAYNLSSGSALAIALLYRLITYWLAIIVGAGALVVANKRHYI